MTTGTTTETDFPVDGLIGTIDRLAALLDEETTILCSARPSDIALLQDEKVRLGRRFAAGVALLDADPARLAAADHDRFRESIARLAMAAGDNERFLRAMTIAADRIVAAMAEALKAQRAPGLGYAGRQPAHRAAATAGITLDRSL